MPFHLPSYPKIYALGHRDIKDIFKGPLTVQEKVDGSQFSFKLDAEGTYWFRSKGADIYLEDPPKMFRPAIETVLTLDLKTDHVYRGECLTKPKHNALKYNRTPQGYIILFDVETQVGQYYMSTEELEAEAKRLRLESVPVLFSGEITDVQQVHTLLNVESILGGPNVEGIVVKNYGRFTHDGHVMMGKYVSEAFKEVHSNEWAKSNPGTKDVVNDIISMYCTEPRWMKSIQFMRDNDQLDNSPKDIGKLLPMIQNDIMEEEGNAIRDLLYQHFSKAIRRGVVAGFPEFYKNYLLKQAFPEPEEVLDSVCADCGDGIDADIVEGEYIKGVIRDGVSRHLACNSESLKKGY